MLFRSVHTKFKEVLLCLRKLAKDNIKPRDPTFSTEHAKVKDSRFWPHFKGAIGAIDGSHVPVSVPEEQVVNHTCRHGYTSQNVLAICDFDMRFTFVVAGWPGSAHDTRILNHALAKFADQFPVPPTGRKCPMSFKMFHMCGLFYYFLGATMYFFRQILSCGFRLSKSNWIPCSFRGEYISSTGISYSPSACASREV